MNDSLTLKELQAYVKKTLKERGFDDETVEQKLLLLVEEVGELAKALRKHSGIKIDKNRPQGEVEHEIADCFIYILDICNKLNIDIEKAFWSKEKINKQRHWA
ncbi:hypothetical protein COX95_02860 [bacterium CG_4_10_14_0_2_um_filter_33_32]|nr:MAG: hypothetical protein AUJ93_02660 [bacterium CG2_30_33_46]PIR67969.1 MAG: hypothetical protein COU50_00405 [bacterium CG10_big_fil_rev_8_21_14_0_10_33_18]PIU77084.1 MAG: hypothetical protein COS74_00580 [bacterium CG06_land_8_20_14_3_00_33_50]PIW81181.1 MAG: hypothetical protein COZ97_03040 [bacterium CG_4_8_14_3_um_filter_33_28]PIY85034.1 MAG: hypothetical protein COY76_04190 [bacterium CG_4_10_14_0_8_um_filter_33_57]PIZ85784.1 MAG: hypothetical protein COX95_02860 [bacterium CG_4_10_1